MTEEQEAPKNEQRNRPIVVEIQGVDRRFENFNEFDEWHSDQWEKVNGYLTESGDYSQQIRPLIKQLNQSVSRFRNAELSLSEADFDNLVLAVENLYRRVYPTDTIKGEFLAHLDEESRQSAGVAYTYFMGQYLSSLSEHEQFKGAVLAALFEEGVSSSKQNFEAVEAAESDYYEWLSKAQGEHATLERQLRDEFKRSQDLVDQANDRAENFQNRLSEWATKFKKNSEERKDKLLADAGEQRDRLKTEIDNLIQTYDDKMALQWPTTYWQKKAESHRDSAKTFTVVFVIMAVLTLLLTCFLSLMLITPLEDIVMRQAATLLGGQGAPFEPKDVSPFAKITAFGAILAIVIWILKIVARNMVSHQHLATDAEERRVMILTYLALLRRGKGMNEKELAIILSTIFRPSVDGMVKEDGGPAPLPAEIFRMMMQKQ